MPSGPGALDLSRVDPFDVVVVVARKAAVDAPDGARAWLAAPRPAPAGESARYVRFLHDLRQGDLRDVIREALDSALAAAPADSRLAELLGHAAPAERTSAEGGADGGETEADALRPEPSPDAEEIDGGDAEADPPSLEPSSDAEQADGGDWYEAPADDPVSALLSVARRAGVPVPDDALAWLTATSPAPFDQTWQYRRMLTSLAVAPVDQALRAAIDDALAGARSCPGRLGDLFEAGRTADLGGTADRPALPAPDRRDRSATFLSASGGRWGARPVRRRRRAGPPSARRLAFTLLALLVGSASAWGVLAVAPRLRAHLPGAPTAPGTAPASPVPASSLPVDLAELDRAAAALVDRVLADPGGAVAGTAPQMFGLPLLPAERPGANRSELTWNHRVSDGAVQRAVVDARERVVATVTAVPVPHLDDLVERMRTGDGARWHLAPSAVPPPVGRGFVLHGSGAQEPVVRHGEITVTSPGDEATQQWLVIPTHAGTVALVAEVASGTSSRVAAAVHEQWLSDASALLVHVSGLERDAVVRWVADTLTAGTGN